MTSCLEEVVVAEIDTENLLGWMEEIIQYLEKGEFPENVVEGKLRSTQSQTECYTGCEELIHS